MNLDAEKSLLQKLLNPASGSNTLSRDSLVQRPAEPTPRATNPFAVQTGSSNKNSVANPGGNFNAPLSLLTSQQPLAALHSTSNNTSKDVQDNMSIDFCLFGQQNLSRSKRATDSHPMDITQNKMALSYNQQHESTSTHRLKKIRVSQSSVAVKSSEGMSTKYSLKKDAQKTALDTTAYKPRANTTSEACNTGKVDKIAKCITISNDEDDVYSSADKDKIMYIYNSHDSDNDNDSDDNNSENSYANSNEDSDANNEDSNDDDEDDDEDEEEDNIDDNYYAYNNHYTGETNSVQDSILKLYAPWLTRDATQTPETLEKFYKIKLEGFGWGLPIKTQVLSSKHFDFEYEPNIEMQSLIHFIQNGILDSQTAVDSKVKQLAGLHYWQYPAEQPSPAQPMAVLQGMAGGQKTNDFIKVKVKRLEAAKVTWWRAFDTLITHYKTNENSYFYYIGRHMTVLFSANKSLLQDCLAAHGVRYMVALVTTHATGLANYLQKHDINYRRLEKESGSEAFRPARRNSNNEELLLVDDLDSLESLIDLAHEWDAHPSYARQSCLPHLVSPIPFLNASIGKAQIGDEKTVLNRQDGKEIRCYRLELDGIILPTGLKQFTRGLMTTNTDVEVRRQLLAETVLCDALPVASSTL